jgi:hypothetical protein
VKYNVKIRVTMSGAETEQFEAADASLARAAAEEYASKQLVDMAKETSPEDEFKSSFVIEEVKEA